MIIFKGNF